MELTVVLSNNYFLALAFLFGLLDESSSCDTKWIRLVYMMSCGKKKRESVWARNETLFDDLPLDFEGALKYFKEKDLLNPAFIKGSPSESEKKEEPLEYRVPKLMAVGDLSGVKSKPATNVQPSILLQKLLPKTGGDNHLGIPGFPAQWDIEEILEEKINENHRREIDRLIEECCKVPPVTTCNGNTFSGACKFYEITIYGEKLQQRMEENGEKK